MDEEIPRYYTTRDKRIAGLLIAWGTILTAYKDPTGTVNFRCDEDAGHAAIEKIYANEKCGSLDVFRGLKAAEDLLWQTVRGS